MMKTNAKRKNSAVKKLIPAAGMLALSASMLATSTYAWFTMNKTVNVTGMEIKTHVGSNLLIAHDTLASTAKAADSSFTTSDNTAVKAILEPVSTSTGKAFWYTLDAKADGSKDQAVSDDPYKPYETDKANTSDAGEGFHDVFSKSYGVSETIANTIISGEDQAYGYVDYVFQIKATNTESTPQPIQLTQLDLTYGAATDGNKAYRVAVFYEDITSNAPAGGPGTLLGTYTPASAANHNGKVVSGTASYADASYISTTTDWVTVPGGATQYYKFVVRLYLEGQDTTCTSATFAPLTSDWKLDLQLDLGDVAGHTEVANINMLTTSGG